jgi:hypothetical protein
MTMVDVIGGQSFLDLVGVGYQLDVRADALLTPESGGTPRPVISLPFDSPTPAPIMVPSNANTSITGGVLNVSAVNAAKTAVVTFPPGKPEKPGGNPAAWDAIPRALEGESWTGSALLTKPAAFAGWDGWVASLQPVTYDSPWATPKPLAVIPGASGSFVPPPRLWIGLRVNYTPGPHWNQLDSSSWDSLGGAATRASYAYSPGAKALAPFTTNGAGAMSLTAGWGAQASAARFTRGTTAAARLAARVGMPLSTPVGVRFHLRASVAMTDVAVYLRPNVGGSLDQVVLGTISVPAGESVWDFAAVTPAVDTTTTQALALVWSTGAVGSTLDITGVQIEPGAVGPFFDGDTADTATVDYSWTGTANASTSTAVDNRPAPTWHSLGLGTADNVTLTAPAAGTLRSALVFSGRVTDMEARFDSDSGATLIDITAQDQRAELANRDVGDQPWVAETLAQRVARIISLSGQKVGYRLDTSMANLPISWRDVDRQGALTLLQELAISGDGVLWAAASLTTGPYLDFESLNERPSLAGLYQLPSGIVVIGPLSNVPGSVQIDACSISREPVRWIQDVADVSTRVATSWRDQTLDPEGKPAPTDRVETTTDAQLEKSIGSRRIAVATQLSQQTPAQQLAANILGRTSTPGWRLSGLVWDADDDAPMSSPELSAMMTLLDGTTRNGCPIVVTGLPDWSPIAQGRTEVSLFVEGGSFSSDDGAWRLDMITSAPTAAGKSATWNDFPSTPHPVTAWRWQDMAPTVRWLDLSGASVTP